MTDNQAPFIQLLTNLSGAKTTAASGSNDQGFFVNVGIRWVVFGPGQHEQCHIANESIILEKLEEHIEILQSFIKKMQES
ncbi:M20/M25/M40 family metallo-hydrolase [Staphylococcus hominis]